MGWVFEFAGMRLAEDELTAAEQASLVTIANESYPHAELDVHPRHCQVCRNAIVVTAAVKSGMPLARAVALLNELSAEATVRAFLAAAGPLMPEPVGVPI